MTVKLNSKHFLVYTGGWISCEVHISFCFLDLGNYRWYSFLIKNKVLFLFQITLGMQKFIFLLTILIWVVFFHVFFLLILKVFSICVSNSSLSPFPSSCNLSPLSRSSLCIITINLTLSIIKFYLLQCSRLNATHGPWQILSTDHQGERKAGKGKDGEQEKKEDGEGVIDHVLPLFPTKQVKPETAGFRKSMLIESDQIST